MKKLTLLIGFFAMFSLFSCKDKCKDVICLNGATCNDGECICPTGFSGPLCSVSVCDECENGNCSPNTGACDCYAGYEGVNCQTETRSKVFGVYNITPYENQCTDDLAGFASGDQNIGAYTLTVSAGIDGVNSLVLEGYSGDNTYTIKATLNTDNSFNIPSQAGKDKQVIGLLSGPTTLSGNGSFTSGTIEFMVTEISEFNNPLPIGGDLTRTCTNSQTGAKQ